MISCLRAYKQESVCDAESMGEEFITVEDGERSTVLDAMALLGGNEYLVQQMVEASVWPNYSKMLFFPKNIY